MPLNNATAHYRGRNAENMACHLLEMAGYSILQRNYRSNGGEVDIVAARENTLTFVEVKYRKLFNAAQICMTPQQQKRVGAAAQAWLAKNPTELREDTTFDVVFLSDNAGPVHCIDAFRPEYNY